MTTCRFLRRADQLLTGSKDTLVKLWDLTTQHCVETLVAHRSEVWSLDVNDTDQWLVTGSSDAELRLWRIDEAVLGHQLDTAMAGAAADGQLARAITLLGTVPRQSTERVATVQFVPGGHFLVCQAHDKLVEIYRVMDAQEAMKRHRKKATKRAKRAAGAAGAEGEGDVDTAEATDGEVALSATDLLVPFHTLRSTGAGRLRSVDVASAADAATTGNFELLLALSNNVLEVHTVQPGLRVKGGAAAGPTGPSTLLRHAVEAPGHSSDVRTLALSTDAQLLCSGSQRTL